MNAHRQRLRRLLKGLKKLPLAEFCRGVEERAFQAGLWTETDGAKRPLKMGLPPLLATPDLSRNLVTATRVVHRALSTLPGLTAERPEARSLLCLTPAEHSWLEQHPNSDTRIFCRLDALLPVDSQTPLFIETNVVGIAGMTYAPAAAHGFFEEFSKWFPEEAGRLNLKHLEDPRRLLWQELRAQVGGGNGLRVGLLDDLTLYKWGGEMGRLADYLTAYGHHAFVVDPRELEWTRETLRTGRGEQLDVLYRFLELQELAEIDAQHPLKALKQAFDHGLVLPSVNGDLDQKSTFELLTNEEFGSHFPLRHQRLLRKHVLWTRLLSERYTSDPEGKRIDLPDYASRERTGLVLKPNRGYGGHGVMLGPLTSQSDWEQAVQEGVGTHVVQRLAPPVRDNLLLTSSSDVKLRDCYITLGLFPGRSGLAGLGRFCESEVVNISQKGGVVPFLTVPQ